MINGLQERFTRIWFENLLTQQWLPAMLDVQTKLERGAQVADVGCGRGRALIKLAQAFPNSRYMGYDVFGPTLERALAVAACISNQSGLQSAPVFGPHSLPLSPGSGQDSVRLSLQSSARASHRSPPARILCH